MKCVVLFLVVVIVAVSQGFSQDGSFAEKYLELRKDAVNGKIQFKTLSGKEFFAHKKTSPDLTDEDIEKLPEIHGKIDSVVIIADGKASFEADDDGKLLSQLLEEQEELASFYMGGMIVYYYTNIPDSITGKVNEIIFSANFGNPFGFGNIFEDKMEKRLHPTVVSFDMTVTFMDEKVAMSGVNDISLIVSMQSAEGLTENELTTLISSMSLDKEDNAESDTESIEAAKDWTQLNFGDFSEIIDGRQLFFKTVHYNALKDVSCRASNYFYEESNIMTIACPPDSSIKYSGDIIIPSKVEHNGKIYAIRGVGVNAFANSDITSVVISEGIDYILPSAFNDCSRLKNLVLPSSVRNIGHSAFQNCSALESVTLPDSLLWLGAFAFNGCRLKSINLPSGLRLIDEYALSVNDFQSITIPDSVYVLNESVLSNCLKLESVTFPANDGWIDKHFLGYTPSIKEIILQSETPPQRKGIIEFFNKNKDRIVVKVPNNAVEKYKADKSWKKCRFEGY